MLVPFRSALLFAFPWVYVALCQQQEGCRVASVGEDQGLPCPRQMLPGSSIPLWTHTQGTASITVVLVAPLWEHIKEQEKTPGCREVKEKKDEKVLQAPKKISTLWHPKRTGLEQMDMPRRNCNPLRAHTGASPEAQLRLSGLDTN